jgi:hypothetical protein
MQGRIRKIFAAEVVHAGGKKLREFSVRYGRGGVVPIDERQIIELASE